MDSHHLFRVMSLRQRRPLVLGLSLSLVAALGLSLTFAMAHLAHAAAITTVTVCDAATLSGAISGAAAGDTLQFSCDGVISLSSALVIDHDITLDATGHNVTLDGGGSARVLQVNSGVHFTLTHLTIAHGKVVGVDGVNPGDPGSAAAGGGLLSHGGVVTINNSVFTNNAVIGGTGKAQSGSDVLGKAGLVGSAGGDASGAAVGCDLNSTLVINASTFTANQAQGGVGGAGGDGGPGIIYPNNDVVLAGQGGNGGVGGRGLGAAVACDHSSVTIRDSVFSQNHTQGGTGGQGGKGGLGGPLPAPLPTASPLPGWPVVQYLHWAGFGGFGGAASGGAVVANAGSAVTISNSDFSSNDVVGGVGAAGIPGAGLIGVCGQCTGTPGGVGGFGAPGTGGAAACESSGTLSIANSTFASNNAHGGVSGAGGPSEQGRGGDSTYGGRGVGGAVGCNAGGALTISNSLLTNNQAQGGAGGAGGDSGTSGVCIIANPGPIGCDGGAGGYSGVGWGGAVGNLSTTTVTSSAISDNSVVWNNGGPGGNGGPHFGTGVPGYFGDIRGGGLFTDGDPSLLTLKDSAVNDNTVYGFNSFGRNDADGYGSALAIGHDVITGALSFADFDDDDFTGDGDPDGVAATITGSTFSGNTFNALFNVGQTTISNSTFTKDQFAIMNYGTLTLANSAVSDNGPAYASCCAGGGRGITNFWHMTITSSTIANNTGDDFYTPGIYNNGTMTIAKSTISGNHGDTRSKVAVWSYYALTITDTTMSNNSTATVGGWGVGAFGALAISNSTFSGNSMSSGGSDAGGVGINSGVTSDAPEDVTISNSTFTGNTAGLVIDHTAPVTISNSTFSSNSTYDVSVSNFSQVKISNSILAAGGTSGNCVGPITDGGNNLDDGATCGFSKGHHSLSNTTPLLGPLASNGGPTQTMALSPASPAINQGNDAVCAAAPVNGVDQRGVTRPQGKHCDIGAYEFVPSVAGTQAEITAALASGAIDNQGIANALQAKLQAAGSDQAKGDCAGYRAILQDFIDQVNGLSGTHITPDAASSLVADAQSLVSYC
jgi:hypothetical protein